MNWLAELESQLGGDNYSVRWAMLVPESAIERVAARRRCGAERRAADWWY
jgi:hypothetical protein